MPPPARRILIGAGSFADARAALRLAERLAGDLAAELGGMLVEEAILYEIADLPKPRVITSSGTMIVAPSRARLRTLVEGDARAFRETLSALARSRKWSFERRRGELISGLCQAARGWDLLLLGHRETQRLPGRVVLIAPPEGAGEAAAGLAGDLAAALRTDVVALRLGPEQPGGTAQGSEHLGGEDALLARIGRIHAAAVVLDLSAGPLRTYDQLRRLHAAARCPLVVLGAGQGEPSLEHATQIPPAPGSAT